MRCSRSLSPRSLQAESAPASATAPVPWTSSLNDGSFFRYRSRTANAESFDRSSHWRTAHAVALLHGVDEAIEECVVLVAAEALLPDAEIARVLEQIGSLGADVEPDREHLHGLMPPDV